MPEFFSDRENGPVPRIHETISPAVWGALYALVEQRISAGAFGLSFPNKCEDSRGTIGSDDHLMGLSVVGAIPSMVDAVEIGTPRYGGTDFRGWPLRVDRLPALAATLDLVEFCFEHVAQPIGLDLHSYYGHRHLDFDQAAGRTSWRSDVNTLFARNGIAFEVVATGHVQRTGTPVLADVVRAARLATGDQVLDDLLADARTRYLSPDPADRLLALQPLWDALERTKTLRAASKKQGISLLLGEVAGGTVSAEDLDAELALLTKIGNTSQIRHFETTTTPITPVEADYLFHRCFALLATLLGLGPTTD